LDFLFSRSGELPSPDPVNIGFPFSYQSSQVAKSSLSSQLDQLNLLESKVAPSKLQATSQYYMQAIARRCSALLEVLDFMQNSITLQEDLPDNINSSQATLGV